MKRRSLVRWLSMIGVTALLMVRAASAADVHVMISAGFYEVYSELSPAFERASGHHLVTTRGPSMGDSPEAIPARLARGETADVVILDEGAADELGRRGLVRADSKVELARSLIGMVIRAGAAKPDISSVEALRSTLLATSSIAYSDSASGAYLAGQQAMGELRTGDAARFFADASAEEWENPLVVHRAFVAFAANGEIERAADTARRMLQLEIGFQQVSELIHVPGVTFVGTIPTEVQPVIFFAGALTSAVRQPEAAMALIRFLASPEARQ